MVSMGSKAQIEKVSLQASGLTCSMCSNSINRALKKLDFVDRVEADVKNYTFEIYFKESSAVDFNKIKQKVEGAGFSVAGFIVTVRFNQNSLENSDRVTVGNNTVILTNVKEASLDGVKRIKLLDKGFVPAQDSKRNSFDTANEGIYHASI